MSQASPSLSLFVGLRYWRARKDTRFVSFITLFSVLGIALGVAALIIVSSVMNGLEGRLKGKILGAVPQLVIEAGEGPISRFEPLLQGDPRIRGAVPMLTSEAMVQRGSELGGVQLLGIDPDTEAPLSVVTSHMLYGQLKDLSPGDYHIILGSQLARRLNVLPGDRVRVMTAQGARYTPMGRVPAQRQFTVAGVFELGSDIDKGLALVNLSDAERLLRQSPDLRLYLNDAFDAPLLSAELAAKAPQQLGETLTLTDWRSQYGQLFSAVKMEKRMMSLLLGLIIAVAAFNIVSALVMMVTDKTADVAILKTLGLSRGQVMGIFSVQGMSSSALGTLVGLTVGLLLANHLQPVLSLLGIWLLPPGQPLPVIIDPVQVASVVGGALSLSFLATLYPAWRASQVNPAEILRYE
ncbi:lipoprotein-releasing ABC transporter permease subunit [Ferrimonas balearica]|uniref:lipoprotein-releasing ABC transporter permease subunit n=1 Tax=Ferrimonas balearica TaxID=44012 RepID=UPI001C5BDB40|nr:lipoprotein-releasing ABC transporter permease subunit [Ferrimonas balearica]MBW3166311.1 lipoprotein-releasing ABC transporter permease subunit [Ferrimonas balearica]MBY6226465.1 lipoprotein-releasing ABC transporter permease subunit [Ferrimonas balearica]